ncbi:MAG: hypothetical protein LIP12_11160, partial [Clostridiales bacterium]|nr:hypothetical protein [Clostridiales bacterium]
KPACWVKTCLLGKNLPVGRRSLLQGKNLPGGHRISATFNQVLSLLLPCFFGTKSIFVSKALRFQKIYLFLCAKLL